MSKQLGKQSMTLDEAKKVADIVDLASFECDGCGGHCFQCTETLVKELSKAFPKFIWEFDQWTTVTLRDKDEQAV